MLSHNQKALSRLMVRRRDGSEAAQDASWDLCEYENVGYIQGCTFRGSCIRLGFFGHVIALIFEVLRLEIHSPSIGRSIHR